MVKRFTMPCHVSHRHGLLEQANGYIIQASDYDVLFGEKTKLEERNALLQKQLNELQKKYEVLEKQKNPKVAKKKKGGWIVKVPVDEDEWIYLTDLATNERMIFETEEEAVKYGTLQGVHKVEKIK
jgi:hypothetical protein